MTFWEVLTILPAALAAWVIIVGMFAGITLVLNGPKIILIILRNYRTDKKFQFWESISESLFE